MMLRKVVVHVKTVLGNDKKMMSGKRGRAVMSEAELGSDVRRCSQNDAHKKGLGSNAQKKGVKQ